MKMAFSREPGTRKSRSFLYPDLPLWLVQADDLPNRLFISPAEKELIDLIQKFGELSKGDLVTYTDHSRTKITSSINSLICKKIIIENQGSEYSGGRRSKTFSLNGSLGCVAGVDIGATGIDLAVADLSQRIFARTSEDVPVREGPVKILGRVCDLLETLLDDTAYDAGKIRGIGIGIPGPVDFINGTVVSPPIMPGWDRYPIIQTVQKRFPAANVVIDNDVNVMALGEINQGVGKGFNNLIYVKIGIGIGAGIICHGKIYRGANGCAGTSGISASTIMVRCATAAITAASKPWQVDQQSLNALSRQQNPVKAPFCRNTSRRTVESCRLKMSDTRRVKAIPHPSKLSGKAGR